MWFRYYTGWFVNEDEKILVVRGYRFKFYRGVFMYLGLCN